MVVGGCDVRGIGWVRENFPAKLLDLLTREIRNMWPSVVVKKDNSFSGDYRRMFPDQGLMNADELLGIERSCDSGILGQQLKVDDSVHIPPNTQHHFPLMKFRLRGWVRRLILVQPVTFSTGVKMYNSFLVTCDNPVKERVDGGGK